MLKRSSILITGGTGSFGHTFVQMTLKKYNPRKIVIFSRWIPDSNIIFMALSISPKLDMPVDK